MFIRNNLLSFIFQSHFALKLYNSYFFYFDFYNHVYNPSLFFWIKIYSFKT